MRTVRGNDAALPWRARRRCVCAYSTLFALRAKALQSGAPDMGVSRKKLFPKTLCPSGGFVGAPENAKPFPRLYRGSVFPMPSRGENGGLCPHPPKGSIPWESLFGGTGLTFPRLPSPKTPQAASPCSWACRRLSPSPPHAERNEAPMPPTRGAWVRVPRAEGTG